MASNDASRRASLASSSEFSLVDPATVAKKLPKKDNSTSKIKVKKPVVKTKTREAENNDINGDGTPRSGSPESSLINELDPELQATFPTGRPMDEKLDLIICKTCKQPFLRANAKAHIASCLQKKQDKAQKKKEAKEAARKVREAKSKAEKDKDKDGDANMEDTVTVQRPDGTIKAEGGSGESNSLNPSARKSAAKATNGDDAAAKKSKKRKADGEADKDVKKKKTKKEEAKEKPKVPKPKGPVDVEKQCGVALPNGAHCARSLTCKSHSMGAKRAVPGRSLPYDMLLAAYQKKNQAKLQKAAINANAPLADEMDPSGPVDSDEEKDAVMAAIARSRPQPLEQHVWVPVRQKYAYVRMKEMLSNALAGSRGGNLFATAAENNSVGGGGGIATVGAGGHQMGSEEPTRRPSLVQQAISQAGAAARAASVAASAGGGGLQSRKPSLGTASVGGQ